MADHAAEIDDQELLYRKVPVASRTYDPDTGYLQAAAFQPHKTNDVTGLSVSRGHSVSHPEFLNVSQAARGPSRIGYYIAVLKACDVRTAGIEITSVPVWDNLGHAEFPQLRSDNRDADETLERMQRLANLCLLVEGPFDGQGNTIG